MSIFSRFHSNIDHGRRYEMFRRAGAGTHRPSPPAKANPLPTPFPPLIPLPFTSIRTPQGSGIGRRDTPLGCARGGQGPLRNDLRPPIVALSRQVLMSLHRHPPNTLLPQKHISDSGPSSESICSLTSRPSITRA